MVISGSNWGEIGRRLAEKVADRSTHAYKYDRDAYHDEPDILHLWKNELAPHAEKSMAELTPNAFQLCRGFQDIFQQKGVGFSVWELLTLYEVDMFIHEFHYKCSECNHRIMEAPRFICSVCEPHLPDSSPKRRSPRRVLVPESICSDCSMKRSICGTCGSALLPTNVLHETMGIGIANKSGCTGFGYRDDESVFCGQTLEMATDTYAYGRFDTVYKLENKSTGISALVYDVGCILSPFGLNSHGLALCVFNLYNSDYALPPYKNADTRVPMAALQWEVLLRGSRDTHEVIRFLRGPAVGIMTFTSASFIVAGSGDCVVIEVTANESWVPSTHDNVLEDNHKAAISSGALPGSKWIVRANNCLAGSSLQATESLPPNISSRERQEDLYKQFEILGLSRPDLPWAMNALSSHTIQTEYCLSTVLMEPSNKRIHVRFRVGTRLSSTLKDGGRWDVFSI